MLDVKFARQISAHAIDGDGTLRHEQFAKLGREAEPDGFPVPVLHAVRNGSHGVHVPGDEVAADRVPGSQSPFEVHAIPGGQLAEICAFERLRAGLKRK